MVDAVDDIVIVFVDAKETVVAVVEANAASAVFPNCACDVPVIDLMFDMTAASLALAAEDAVAAIGL